MSARDYLGALRYMERRIDAKTEAAARMRARAERIATVLTGMPRGSGSGSPMESAAVELADLETDLMREAAELRERRREAAALLAMMQDERLRTVLDERYLCRMSWQRVARDIYCSYDHVFRLHRQALVEFGKILAREHIDSPCQ